MSVKLLALLIPFYSGRPSCGRPQYRSGGFALWLGKVVKSILDLLQQNVWHLDPVLAQLFGKELCCQSLPFPSLAILVGSRTVCSTSESDFWVFPIPLPL